MYKHWRKGGRIWVVPSWLLPLCFVLHFNFICYHWGFNVSLGQKIPRVICACVLLSFLLSQSPTSDQVERSGRITWIQNVTSKKENVGPKRDRMLVNVCMHFHIDNLGQWEGTVQASDTLTLLHADHWEKKGQETWDFGRITYFSFLKST